MLQLWNNTREMAFKFTSDDSKHKIFTLSEEEFKEPIQDEYAKEIGALSPAELYDNYNPGPTLPNGGVNFECHCVSHLVASPCGYEFREAIKCQKAAGESELEEGACADELIEFMRCAMRTECFRARNDDSDDSNEGNQKTAPDESKTDASQSTQVGITDEVSPTSSKDHLSLSSSPS